MKTPATYCKRACPIKAKGHCHPERCHVVSVDDPVVQKSLDGLPFEFKLRVEQDADSLAFVRCGEMVWVTIKDGKVHEDGQKEIARLQLPRYIEFETNRDMGYHG